MTLGMSSLIGLIWTHPPWLLSLGCRSWVRLELMLSSAFRNKFPGLDLGADPEIGLEGK